VVTAVISEQDSTCERNKETLNCRNSCVPQKNSGKTAFLTIAADLIHY
jgi:hypothetical protein